MTIGGAASNEDQEYIALSLCDGMGTFLHVLEKLGIPVTRYIGVEKQKDARVLSDNLNDPKASRCGGIDHSWHCDVFNITRQDIEKLGRGTIAHLAIQAPCQDHSPLRLLPRKNSKSGKRSDEEKRPGFRGKHGKVFLKCLEIFS